MDSIRLKTKELQSKIYLTQTHRLGLIDLLGRRQANLCFHFAGSGEICRTLQSHVMQVWTMTFWLLAPDPDKAEPLPVLSNKLPFFSTDALAQIA